MQLSQTERERLSAILEQYDHHPKVQEMREFIQHGDVTTYQHCKNVVVVSCWINHRFHLGADETTLAVGPSSMISTSMTGTSRALSTACGICLRCTAFPTRGLPV